jgi:hypothetical protein
MAQGTITSIDQLVKAKFYWAISTAEACERKQLPWCLFNNYPLVDSSKYAQVRPIEHLAPSREINEYAQMMRLGDQFPPVIVTADGYLVDGHTRTEAARRNGYHEFPALVLTTVYLGDLSAESPFRDQVMSLGVERNRQHGRRMSNADVARIIEQLSPRHTVAEIVSDNGVSKSFATAVWNAARVKRETQALDIKWANTFSLSLLKLFGGKIDRYTSPVWGELFKLAQDANLKQQTVVAMMKRIEEFRSEAEKLAYISMERDSYTLIINTGGYTPVSKSRRVKQALGVIRKNTAEAMIEKSDKPQVRNEYLAWLMESDELIRKTIDLQEHWNSDVLNSERQ